MKAKFLSALALLVFGLGLSSAHAGGLGVLAALSGYYRYDQHTGEKYSTNEAARNNAWEVVSNGLVLTSGIVMRRNINLYGGPGKGWAAFLIIADGSTAENQFVSEMEAKFGMDRADASALTALLEKSEGDASQGVEYTWSVSQANCAKIASFPSLSAANAASIQEVVCQ